MSGSILEVIRFLKGKSHPVDDDLVLMWMAILCIGGHHSLTETGVAVSEWGYLADVSFPFCCR